MIVKANNGKGEYSETLATIPVVDAGYGAQANISAYLQGEGFTSTATTDNVIYTKSNAAKVEKLQLINKSLINNFGFTFSFVENYSEFEAITLRLQGYQNPNNVLNIVFTREGNTVTYYFNDRKDMTYSFDCAYGENVVLVYKKDVNTLVVNNDLKIELDAIKVFSGFNEDYANVDIIFSGIKQNANIGIAINKVYDQHFHSGADYIVPTLYGERPSNRCSINEPYIIKSVQFYDLIDPNVSAKLSVTYKGKAVTATDGTEMKRVSCARDYEIVFTEYGKYTVEYLYTDYAGNTGRYTYVISVQDLEAPTLEFNGNVRTEYKVGDEVHINNAIISDNVSEGMKLKTYHFLHKPDGTVAQTEISFKVTQAGDYKIYYYIIDEAGNTSIYNYVIHVR